METIFTRIRKIAFILILMHDRIKQGLSNIKKYLSGKRHAMDLLHKAYDHEFRGETEEAVKYYESAAAKYPELHKVRAALARCNLRLLKFDTARTYAEEYLDVDPADPESNLYMGIILYYLNRAEEALSYLMNANKLFLPSNKKKSRGLEYMGECYLKLDKAGEAADCFTEAIRLGNQAASRKLLNIGEKFYNEQNFKQSLDIFLKIVKLQPENYEAWNNLGTVLWSLEDKVKALNCYKESLDIRPDYQDALINMQTIERSMNHGKTNLKNIQSSFAVYGRG